MYSSLYISFCISELDKPDHFNFQHELRQAARGGTLTADVRVEIDKIMAADLVVLQFPMYWLGLPALLKGWIDRYPLAIIPTNCGYLALHIHGC